VATCGLWQEFGGSGGLGNGEVERGIEKRVKVCLGWAKVMKFVIFSKVVLAIFLVFKLQTRLLLLALIKITWEIFVSNHHYTILLGRERLDFTRSV
jgi:hypothetical protein